MLLIWSYSMNIKRSVTFNRKKWIQIWSALLFIGLSRYANINSYDSVCLKLSPQTTLDDGKMLNNSDLSRINPMIFHWSIGLNIWPWLNSDVCEGLTSILNVHVYAKKSMCWKTKTPRCKRQYTEVLFSNIAVETYRKISFINHE